MLTGQVVLVVVNTDGGPRAVLHPDCQLFAAVIGTLLEDDVDLRDLLASLCAQAARNAAKGPSRSFLMTPPISTC